MSLKLTCTEIMEKMWVPRLLFVVFVLCAALVKAAELDDAVCSKTVKGSTAEYDDDGEFLGCVDPNDDYEIDDEEDNSFSDYPYGCEGDGYIDPKTGTQQCCPSGMHFEINSYFPTEGGCCPLGYIYAWDSNKMASSCQPSPNDQGTELLQQPGNLVSYPGYPYPDPRYPYPDPRYPYPDPRYPYPDPRYPDPRYPDPRYPDPRYPDPRYPSPGQPYPGYPYPGHPYPGHPYPGHPYPVLTCPNANQMIEFVDGVEYRLWCHRGYSKRSRSLKLINANTVLECLKACSADRLCTAANFWWNQNRCSLGRGRIIMGRYRRSDRLISGIVRGYVRG